MLSRLWARADGFIAAGAGVVAGLVVVACGGGPAPAARPAAPPLGRPAGLSASTLTASSVTLGWRPYASGRRPAKWEILENGTVLASVPGELTRYRVTGLSVGTAYQFSVIAVSGTSRSGPSAAVLASTALASTALASTGLAGISWDPPPSAGGCAGAADQLKLCSGAAS
jgi:hypothetical protein